MVAALFISTRPVWSYHLFRPQLTLEAVLSLRCFGVLTRRVG